MNKLNAAPEKVKRKKKKPRIPKMPNKIVIIKNADKDSGNWMETWDKPKNRNPVSPSLMSYSKRNLYQTESKLRKNQSINTGQ